MKNYCKDCLHYNACKSMFIRGLDDYTAVRKLLMNYQEDMFDNEHYADVYSCEDFTPEDEWIHLPYNIGDTFYYIGQCTQDEEFINEYCVCENQISSIDYDGRTLTFFDLDGIDFVLSEMFFTREDAENRLKEVKGGNE